MAPRPRRPSCAPSPSGLGAPDPWGVRRGIHARNSGQEEPHPSPATSLIPAPHDLWRVRPLSGPR